MLWYVAQWYVKLCYHAVLWYNHHFVLHSDTVGFIQESPVIEFNIVLLCLEMK